MPFWRSEGNGRNARFCWRPRQNYHQIENTQEIFPNLPKLRNGAQKTIANFSQPKHQRKVIAHYRAELERAAVPPSVITEAMKTIAILLGAGRDAVS